MTEHNINRRGATGESDEQDADTERDDNADEQRSEAEIKRELRKSTVGRAILDYARQRGR